MLDAAAFAAAVRAVLPQGVALGKADPSRLHPVAACEVLQGAVPKRLAEFSAGRFAARAAFADPDIVLPVGADRAPVWPDGSVGSITHCAGLCLAVVGKSDTYWGLGLDAEPDHPLEEEIWDSILRRDEVNRDGSQALAYFVAKEAAYKAQYAVTRHLFGFNTLRLIFEDNQFVAEFVDEIGPFSKGHRLCGSMIRAGGYLGAFVALSRD